MLPRPIEKMFLEGSVVFCVFVCDDHFVAVKLQHLQYLLLAASQIFRSPLKNFCVGFKFINKKKQFFLARRR